MENKLEVGMYVRFKKGKVAYIRKLLEVIHNFETFDVYRTDKEYFDYEEKDYFDIVYPDEILGEPSYDITDLLEINDIAVLQYKNKYNDIVSRKFEVERITDKYINFVSRRADWIYDREEKSFIDDFNLGQPVIKQILTHEQFEQNSYKIGE